MGELAEQLRSQAQSEASAILELSQDLTGYRIVAESGCRVAAVGLSASVCLEAYDPELELVAPRQDEGTSLPRTPTASFSVPSSLANGCDPEFIAEDTSTDDDDPEPCTAHWPCIGDVVQYNDDLIVRVNNWELQVGDGATVVEVDADGDFRLRNEAGAVSEFQFRKFFVYVLRNETRQVMQRHFDTTIRKNMQLRGENGALRDELEGLLAVLDGDESDEIEFASDS